MALQFGAKVRLHLILIGKCRVKGGSALFFICKYQTYRALVSQTGQHHKLIKPVGFVGQLEEWQQVGTVIQLMEGGG
jgi:hypothetical protein